MGKEARGNTPTSTHPYLSQTGPTVAPKPSKPVWALSLSLYIYISYKREKVWALLKVADHVLQGQGEATFGEGLQEDRGT